jgi:NADP-dependent 3-hydroxy acid dehydrogenase YdfG
VKKWVLVTGASAGIGRAVVERLAKECRPVIALARRRDRLDELVASFGSDMVWAFDTDVRDGAAVEEVVAQVATRGDGIDVLVNNAGLSLGFGPITEGDPRDWQIMVDTNITALLNCTHAVLPLLRDGGGHVVNLGSLAAEHEYLGGNVYGATKAFVHHLSANLRVDLQGTGIRVTCVAPGMVRTEFATVRFRGDSAKADALYDGITPLRPEDVADAVLWAINTPPHVNVNYIELMSIDQPFGLALSRAAMRKETL